MAGRVVDNVSATVTDASADGYVTVADVTGFYEGARAYLGDPNPDRPDVKEVTITEVDTTNDKLGIRFKRDLGTGPSYGRDSVSAYAPEIRLNYTGDAGTGQVSGAPSGAVADVVSSTATYLVIENLVGNFLDEDVLTFDVGGPGEADGAEYTVSSVINMPSQFIFNPNDKPLD